MRVWKTTLKPHVQGIKKIDVKIKLFPEGLSFQLLYPTKKSLKVKEDVHWGVVNGIRDRGSYVNQLRCPQPFNENSIRFDVVSPGEQFCTLQPRCSGNTRQDEHLGNCWNTGCGHGGRAGDEL